MANGIKDVIGVYGIYNKITGECIYVGSGGLRNRESTHLGLLRHGNHKNKLLQKIYDEIGENNLEDKILEYCDDANKKEVETKYYKSLNPVCCLEEPKDCPRYKENYPKMSAAQRGSRNPNARLTEEDIVQIKIYMRDHTYRDIELAKMYNVSLSHINNIRRGLKWKHVEI
ncbi:endonuclease [Clostridium pasteurianum DSM 525 = ATCC 6013]|uniref:Endonuclease n=1 Tax=Clostridium pasteurianum DSM 525 = ATCC 6013 TaxID=1262449 RepID=A0A0H3JAH2_CLOPA|nr:GIY-YIG nuclease family protein [Clostridium pasteurianum]AJA49548.1 endonuclease [Clostridium pasteurianum DSM 525 = ATCC 6013]AJA53536.1 endonuclease [Clostridium pasteurianum DSM 525 = ATCC 6013]AOZ76703.1 hypothetical protein AQ983_16935 [Clostridium pasteurianum DSM 525 = ATCC 6013]AOZ80500.1 hypothetical protein AQ984_16930 [Clostridium pasteurianum]ELP58935.1 endonuclease [Clostridium pasteurianum DSM 525 = ATCC 6013]